MRRFNSHKTVVVFSPASFEKFFDFVQSDSMIGSYFATSQVMPASIQGYERNYKCAKDIDCAIVRPKVERADVSANALQSEDFARVSVMKNVSLAGITLQLELHKLRRPTQDNETNCSQRNDRISYFVLAFCQEGGYSLILIFLCGLL